jgi:hypothetical protein
LRYHLQQTGGQHFLPRVCCLQFITMLMFHNQNC